MTDEQIVLSLLRRLLAEAYVDTMLERTQTPRLVIDGTLWDVTADELAAFERWVGDGG